jgi:hypothetical protein
VTCEGSLAKEGKGERRFCRGGGLSSFRNLKARRGSRTGKGIERCIFKNASKEGD